MKQVTQIEVFKTTVNTSLEANRIHEILRSKFPDIKVNFDLDDCDNILRTELCTDSTQVRDIIGAVRDCGHEIAILD